MLTLRNRPRAVREVNVGRHSAAEDHSASRSAPTEVTLRRVSAALDSLGLEPLTHPDRPDRVVVAAYAFVATVWFSHDKPLMLVIDFAERIPTEFEHAAELAEFVNEWNRDRVGPAASFRLMDSGDCAVGLRHAMKTRLGLTDDQLMGELADAFEYAAAFFTEQRRMFLPAEFDHPLPPSLARAQDAETLLGRHPAERHLPRGQRRGAADVHDVPDLFKHVSIDPEDPVEPVDLNALAETLDMLDFAYAVASDEVISTGVNGIAFGVCIDAGRYARVSAVWDTGVEAAGHFLAFSLTCNDLNQRAAGLRAYLVDAGDVLHLHVESSCLITQGLSAEQLHNWVITSLVSILGAVDTLSTEFRGASAVQWPGAAEG